MNSVHLFFLSTPTGSVLELISKGFRFDLGVKGVDSRPNETYTSTE